MMQSAPKASWYQRAGATLIDALLLSAVGLAVGIALSAGGTSSQDATLAIYAVVFSASLIYSPILMAREGDANGQTIGKRALKIRVVHADGHPMTLSRGLLRDGVGKAILGIIPLYTVADVLLPLFDVDRQAIHDKVGSTYVVDAEQVPVLTHRSSEGFAPPSSHEPWSAPPPPPPSAPMPPPAAEPAPAPAAQPTPPPTPAAQPTPPPAPSPDLGGFAPPAPPRQPAPAEEEEEVQRGPFGPSYD